MGIVSKIVIMRWSGSNKKWFESKGYVFTKINDEFEVKVRDLSKGSKALVEVECNGCGKLLTNIKWTDYLKCVKEDGKYYCKDCASKLIVSIKNKNIMLRDNNTFGYWLIKNLSLKKAISIIARWDYKLNKCDPRDICYSSHGFNKKGYYFKCPKNIHPSEQHNIASFTQKDIKTLDCKACNSIGQYLIDIYGESGLRDYWDYEKNNKLGLDPFEIDCKSHKKVWIKCQEKSYHDSYYLQCDSFVKGDRCPYCTNRNGKVHPLDSLGQYIINNYGKEFLDKIWSDKNEKSAFEYAPNSHIKVYWKCLDDKHEDYFRSIKESNICEFRCPECQYSKGEKKIENYLINNKFIKNIDYIPQKEFDGLIGLGNGNLSYDFYLPKFNLLIEYQGEQHEKYIRGFHKNKKDFEKQVEHDRRKKEYADSHNIKLLPIWYWDYDNIEKILDKELNIYKIREVS